MCLLASCQTQESDQNLEFAILTKYIMYTRNPVPGLSRPTARTLGFELTLESGIDVGQGITVGPGKFVKKNKRRALNKRRAQPKCANLCNKKPIKLENFCRLW